MNKKRKGGDSTSTPVEPSDRRTFIKSTIVGAGAVATGLAAMNVTAEAAQDRGLRGFKGTVSLHFPTSAQPSLEDLQRAIAQIVTWNGCRACGLVGFDIRFARVNPAERLKDVNVKGGEAFFQGVG